MLTPPVGLIKVATFPGAVGLSFAKGLDAAIENLKQQGCTRLMVDIRGNVGGGLGSLRLMSYLCDGKIPVGHSLTRNRLRKGYKGQTGPHQQNPAHENRTVYDGSAF